MDRTTSTRRRGVVVAAVVGALLTAAGCGTDSEPAHPRSSESSEPLALTWKFEHIADFRGKLSDLAVLAEDDVWAVTVENNETSVPHLLHYDGKRWEREPLPRAFGPSPSPPALEKVGEALWLRPQSHGEPPGPASWAQWDGARWSAVPNPPPGSVRDFEAGSPDDIWTLDGRRTARHWDGTSWTTTQLPHDATDLTIAGADVWAVGNRTTGPGTELRYSERYSQPAAMRWDGKSWTPVRTPEVRFDDPIPPEPGAGLDQVLTLDSGEVRAYGHHSFNHGEVENEPSMEYLRFRWDGSKWVDQEPAPGECARRTPMGEDEQGLLLDGNWYLTAEGECVKIKRKRLPLSTGARKDSNQSLWLEEIHRVPGTDEWLGSGHVQVNQSGDPFGAPVVVRLVRGD